MRLIDIDNQSLQEAIWRIAFQTRQDIYDLIATQPTVDAVPVVLCKNCVHYDFGVCLKIYSDGNAHPEAWRPRRLEDFCSYGERKELE